MQGQEENKSHVRSMKPLALFPIAFLFYLAIGSLLSLYEPKTKNHRPCMQATKRVGDNALLSNHLTYFDLSPFKLKVKSLLYPCNFCGFSMCIFK